MKRKLFCVLIALVFVILNVCSALPITAAAEAGMRYSTPPGYNGNDYQKLVTFLELKDSGGVKNGKKLNSSYSPTAPNTWTGVTWDGSRVTEVEIISKGLVGKLDLSGCTKLSYVNCASNSITELNVSGCSALMAVSCSGCSISKLDLSNCTSLQTLICNNNSLTQLDVSDCTQLWLLSCTGNQLVLLDLTANPAYNIKLRVAGSGWVGIEYEREYDEEWDEDVPVDYYCAQPRSGKSFIGWYTESGSFISSSARLKKSSTSNRSLVARFTGWDSAILGDANGDGTVDTTDALLVLRCALGISGSAQQLLSNCDMDGNRRIDTTDALMILRTALGIA